MPAKDYFMTVQSEPTSDKKPVGFLTDTTLCIGCKACEVACKQWNSLPMDNFGFTASSYDNTHDLGATTWRHVTFVEQFPGEARPTSMPPFQSNWLMMSDICKHCVNPPCMQACPTGAIVITEYGTVVIQQDVCNGCGYCVPACPFGVPELSTLDNKAHKCTLCYDRLGSSLEPACSKACPTDSIQFGYTDELAQRAHRRVDELRERGVATAYVYGDQHTGGTGGIGGLRASFILTAPSELYNLPAEPELPQRKSVPGYLSTLAASAAFGVMMMLCLKK